MKPQDAPGCEKAGCIIILVALAIIIMLSSLNSCSVQESLKTPHREDYLVIRCEDKYIYYVEPDTTKLDLLLDNLGLVNIEKRLYNEFNWPCDSGDFLIIEYPFRNY